MASNKNIYVGDGLYLTSPTRIQAALERQGITQPQQRNPSTAVRTEDRNEISEEYEDGTYACVDDWVIKPNENDRNFPKRRDKNEVEAQPVNTTIKPKRNRREVRSFSDEDNYALPDLEADVPQGCSPTEPVPENEPKPKNIPKSNYSGKRCKITTAIVVFLVVGAIPGGTFFLVKEFSQGGKVSSTRKMFTNHTQMPKTEDTTTVKHGTESPDLVHTTTVKWTDKTNVPVDCIWSEWATENVNGYNRTCKQLDCKMNGLKPENATGKRYRRVLQEPSSGGEPCAPNGERSIEDCIGPCPVNCQWSAWSVGGCSKTCGGGRRTRSRTKFFTEGHGGTCSGQFSRTQSCNNQRCPGCWTTTSDKCTFPFTYSGSTYYSCTTAGWGSTRWCSTDGPCSGYCTSGYQDRFWGYCSYGEKC